MLCDLRNKNVEEEARACVKAGLSYTVPTVAQVAAEIGLSVRTLQRRLHERGLSFSRLLDEERRTRSLAKLQRGETLPRDWYRMLGYVHSTAFERALKRWLPTIEDKTGRTE